MEKPMVIIQLTEEEKTDLFRMRSEGCSMREISEYIGCSVSAIKYHLHKAGLGYRYRWSPEEDSRLIEMYNEGMTCTQIGKELGRPYSNIAHRISYLRKLGRGIGFHNRK